MSRRSAGRGTVQLRVGGASDVGRLRQANEDSMLTDEDARLFAVADGMGGHRAGDVASATALEEFESRTVAGDALADALQAANTAVFEKAQANPDMRGMGTTVTAVHIDGSLARLAHVGDSRAYLLRDGDLTQVTDDHSLVEELVREGRLTPEQAAVHPQRSIITRALGVDDSVDVDTYEIELRTGDRLMLCSDGLTSMLREDRIGDLLRTEPDPQAAADSLVAAANEAGGEDNITVVIVDVAGVADRRGRARKASGAVAGAPSDATGEWERPADFADQEAEPHEDEEGGDTRWRRRRRRRAEGRPFWPRVRRLVMWLVPLLLVVAVAIGALAWYARRTYFVGFERERVTVFQGVPGGFLGWDPTVEDRSPLTADDLTPHQQEELDDGKRFSSRGEAERYVVRLEREVERREQATTTTAPPTPTTSAPTTGAP